MDIEQLKLILETLQGVGHEAGNLAGLYLWLQFGASILGHLTFASVFIVLFYLIYRAVRMSNGHDEFEAFLCEMRDQLGTGVRGVLIGEERHRTMTALRQLVAKHKEKNT
jgi:hypothetical protein